jgi:hypothetical protein
MGGKPAIARSDGQGEEEDEGGRGRGKGRREGGDKGERFDGENDAHSLAVPLAFLFPSFSRHPFYFYFYEKGRKEKKGGRRRRRRKRKFIDLYKVEGDSELEEDEKISFYLLFYFHAE